MFTCCLPGYHSWPSHRRENPYGGLKSGTSTGEKLWLLQQRKIAKGAPGGGSLQFNRFIHDLEKGVSCELPKFADGVKLFKLVSSRTSCEDV